MAGALGCISAPPSPPVEAPRAAAAIPAPPPVAEAEPPRASDPEPDWDLDEGAFGLGAATEPSAATLWTREPPRAVTPAHGARVMGTIDRQLIREHVREGLEDFRACYRGAAGEGLEGAVPTVLRFTIGSDGRVVDAEARIDAEGAEALGACLEEALGRLRFPPPAGGGVVRISYPIRFVPS